VKKTAEKPPLVPAVTPFALVPPISSNTKKLVVIGSLGLLGVAVFLYWRSTRKGASNAR
jgi:hypothetical protein